MKQKKTKEKQKKIFEARYVTEIKSNFFAENEEDARRQFCEKWMLNPLKTKNKIEVKQVKEN